MSLNTFVVGLAGDSYDAEKFAWDMASQMDGYDVMVTVPKYRPYMTALYDESVREDAMWAVYVDNVFTCEHVSQCILIAVIPSKEPYRAMVHDVCDVIFRVSGEAPEFDCLDVGGSVKGAVEIVRELVSRGF